MRDVKKFFWDDLNLYHNCAHVIIRRCMPNVEMLIVLEVCHSSRVSGYHVGVRTHHKFCSLDTILPTIHKESRDFTMSCYCCKREGGISKTHDLPMNPILII